MVNVTLWFGQYTKATNVAKVFQRLLLFIFTKAALKLPWTGPKGTQQLQHQILKVIFNHVAVLQWKSLEV